MSDIFVRDEHNPLLTADELPHPGNTVFNAAAADLGEEIVLVLRVESCSGRSHLLTARSQDGVGGWRFDETAFLHPSRSLPYEENGIGDCRIKWMEDLDCWAVVYTAYGPHGPAIAVAKTEDFREAERLGVVIPPTNKDGALFPCPLHGRYALLVREAGGSIWLTYSPDLCYWGEPKVVLPPRGGPWWDNVRVGAGIPPIRTEHGWLLVYHGVTKLANQPMYRIGGALTDLEKPHELIARCRRGLLAPESRYERTGDAPNVIYTCGGLVRDRRLWMYYGTADSHVCLATASLQDVLDVVQEERVRT